MALEYRARALLGLFRRIVNGPYIKISYSDDLVNSYIYIYLVSLYYGTQNCEAQIRAVWTFN